MLQPFSSWEELVWVSSQSSQLSVCMKLSGKRLSLRFLLHCQICFKLAKRPKGSEEENGLMSRQRLLRFLFLKKQAFKTTEDVGN